MSTYNITTLLQSVNFVADSIFIGLKFLVPVIFLISILRINIKKPDLLCLTIAINLLLLIGSILFLFGLLTNTFMTLSPGNDDEWNFIMSIIAGPHWFQFIIPVFNFGILPNIFWIKKLQKSVYASFIVILWWFASSFLVDYLTKQDKNMFPSSANHSVFPLVEYAEKSIIFLVLIVILYFLVVTKMKRTLLKNRQQ